MRPTATATISFGMVSIPVKLFSATESKASISFNMLHEKCKGRVKQQYICERDNNEVVPRTEMVKGYEFAKDQYVVFTPDEIKKMEEEKTGLVDIAEFLDINLVDPVYYEGASYLAPDKGGEKAYRLLCDAMKKTGRVAVARWAARGKQYLVLLRPLKNVIILQQLRYPDEVRALDEVPVGTAESKENELKLAVQLIDQITSPAFEPAQYEDEVRKRMQAAIDRKIQGQEIASAPEQPRAQIIDIMEALKASLAARKGDLVS
ncbi:MAG: Ku protein [Vicinamibacteria bacterium]|jgi:DNA end-binding protein Ku|nr:Ku protein [Vicinamibacteria bacterium]